MDLYDLIFDDWWLHYYTAYCVLTWWPSSDRMVSTETLLGLNSPEAPEMTFTQTSEKRNGWKGPFHLHHIHRSSLVNTCNLLRETGDITQALSAIVHRPDILNSSFLWGEIKLIRHGNLYWISIITFFLGSSLQGLPQRINLRMEYLFISKLGLLIITIHCSIEIWITWFSLHMNCLEILNYRIIDCLKVVHAAFEQVNRRHIPPPKRSNKQTLKHKNATQ